MDALACEQMKSLASEFENQSHIHKLAGESAALIKSPAVIKELVK